MNLAKFTIFVRAVDASYAYEFAKAFKPRVPTVVEVQDKDPLLNTFPENALLVKTELRVWDTDKGNYMPISYNYHVGLREIVYAHSRAHLEYIAKSVLSVITVTIANRLITGETEEPS